MTKKMNNFVASVFGSVFYSRVKNRWCWCHKLPRDTTPRVYAPQLATDSGCPASGAVNALCVACELGNSSLDASDTGFNGWKNTLANSGNTVGAGAVTYSLRRLYHHQFRASPVSEQLVRRHSCESGPIDPEREQPAR